MKIKKKQSNHSPPGQSLGEATLLKILRVADLLIRIGDTKVFGKDLTQAQFNILMILKRIGGREVSQKEIVEKIVSTKGNVSIHIANLVRQGYIRKKVSNRDSRMNSIILTAKGKQALERLEPLYLYHIKQITEGLPHKQTQQALDILEHLHQQCCAALGMPIVSNSEDGSS